MSSASVSSDASSAGASSDVASSAACSSAASASATAPSASGIGGVTGNDSKAVSSKTWGGGGGAGSVYDGTDGQDRGGICTKHCLCLCCCITGAIAAFLIIAFLVFYFVVLFVFVTGTGANNVIVDNQGVDAFFATLGRGGIMYAGLNGTVVAEKLGDLHRADDVALSDDGMWLFAIDALTGRLAVFDADLWRAAASAGTGLGDDSVNPIAIEEVDVGPYTGVAFGGGYVVVSGGTSLMTVYRVNSEGKLDGSPATFAWRRGKPDVVMSPLFGTTAFVSTHFSGRGDESDFGVTIMDINNPPAEPTVLSEIHIATAGFTEGVTRPANFPISVAVVNNATIAVASGDGVRFYDVSNLADPELVSTVSLDGLFDGVGLGAGANGTVIVVGNTPAPGGARINAGAASAVDLAFDAGNVDLERPTGAAVGATKYAVAGHGDEIFIASL